MPRVGRNTMKEAKELLDKNPNMTIEDFVQQTGLSASSYYRLKKIEDISELRQGCTVNKQMIKSLETRMMKLQKKQEMKIYLKQRLKENGYVNDKGTFLERM